MLLRTFRRDERQFRPRRYLLVPPDLRGGRRFNGSAVANAAARAFNQFRAARSDKVRRCRRLPWPDVEADGPYGARSPFTRIMGSISGRLSNGVGRPRNSIRRRHCVEPARRDQVAHLARSHHAAAAHTVTRSAEAKISPAYADK